MTTVRCGEGFNNRNLTRLLLSWNQHQSILPLKYPEGYFSAYMPQFIFRFFLFL